MMTIDELWNSALDEILTMGRPLPSRDGGCQELIGWQGQLDDIRANMLLDSRRKASITYGMAEFLWYLSGAKTTNMIEAYAPQYARFTEHGVAHGAYGDRLRNSSCLDEVVSLHARKLQGKAVAGQIAAVITLLQEQPNTRQAIVTMWNPGDLIHAILRDHKDLPCTLSLSFFLRDGRLHCVANMRSNDIWLGFPYDVFCFTSLQYLLAEVLGVEPGTYTHQVGSLHLYDRDREKVDKQYEYHDNSARNCWSKDFLKVSELTKRAVATELLFRRNYTAINDVESVIVKEFGENTFFADMMIVIAKKWYDLPLLQPSSPVLQRSMGC